MARNTKNRVGPGGRVADLLLDGKKTILAFALVTVMAIMWVRVLIGNKPGSAAAASQETPAAPADRKEPVEVRMIALPRIPGRHDSISRDYFDMRDRMLFQASAAIKNPGTDKTEVPTVPPDRDQEVIQQVAQTLKLEAVLRSDNPRAFLNDRLLAVGDRFTVERGTGFLEFEVLWIYEDAVLVECNGIQLTLKLAQYVDVRK